MGLQPIYKITSLHGNIKQITDNYSIIKNLNIPIYSNLPLHSSTIISLHLKSTNEETTTKPNNPSTTNIVDNNNTNIKTTINNSVNKKTILVISPTLNKIICGHPSTGMLCRQKDVTICSREFLEIVNKIIASKVIESYLEQLDMHPNMAIKFSRK